MAITIKHAKTDNIADWTQADLDAQIALGNFPPGTVLADIVLPSDWNNSHTLSGTVPVANGGTGATTLTGYVKGNGTSAFTASSTVPSTDITGLGTMSTQNANSVSITGGSISGTTVSGYIPTTDRGIANGVASLDGSGTVPVSQLPAAVLGALSYQGTWNASTNTPTLTSSVGTKGYYYVVNVAGSTNLNGITDWVVGDWAVYNGSAWQKVDNTDAVTSVNGYTGTVVLSYTDVGAAPTTSGTSILYGNGSGGFSNVTVGSGLSFSTGTLSATGSMVYPSAGIPNSTGSAWGTSYGTTGANSVVVRDANQNIAVNSVDDSYLNQAAGTAITLTAASARRYTITGSGGQTIKLPDATTLSSGAIFQFDNNQTSGAITVNNNSNTLIVSVPSGGYVLVNLLSNATSAGSWDRHDQAPSNVSWSTNTLDYAGSITSATWNGTAIALNRGGTNANLTAVNGGAVYSTGSALAITAAGTSGQVLTSNGASAPTWTTPAAGTVTSVTGTAPIASSGGATPAISISQATTSTNGYLSSTDWNTFNGKQPAGTYVTSVGATSPVTSTGGTTPTIAMPAATTSVSGYLTSTDWNTFNNKGSGTVTSVAVTAPSIFSVAGSPITSSGTIALTYSGTALPIANGGTGATTASAAFNALSPLTTSGDILYGATSGAGTRLGIGTAGQVLTVSVGGLPTWSTMSVGLGTVTSVSVVSANGFAGTVATSTTTPAITLTTSITGVLKGNGTAISAATSGTDYSAGTSSLTTGILKSTTTTGALSIAVAADFPTLNQNTTGTAANVTGTVAVANGGTGLTSTPANGALDIGNGTGFTRTTLTAGTGISVTNASGSITIANSAPSVSWQSVQTSGFTAVAGNGYPCNTTSAAFTVTLPASPSAGNIITLTDYAGTWDTNNITLALNGNKLNSSTSNATLSTKRQSISIVYIDTTQGWIAYNGFLGSIPSQSYTVSYLIVAGGGGAGSGATSNTRGGGGGGAGGLLSGTTTLNSLTVYTVTVGAGGAGTSTLGNPGSVGNNSSFTGLTTASGGGYGGSSSSSAGGAGGSGGGGSIGGAGGSGTSGQGNAGGGSSSSSNTAAGGGGGSGGAGQSGASFSYATGADGGVGTASSITGSSITYAAGGSGGGRNGDSPAAATANTGNGGLGGGNPNGSAGGSGVVILSVPTTNYTGTTTGSPTITTSGSNTIIKFTASGSYTA